MFVGLNDHTEGRAVLTKGDEANQPRHQIDLAVNPQGPMMRLGRGEFGRWRAKSELSERWMRGEM